MNELFRHPQTLLDALIVSVLDDLALPERISIADLDEHELKTPQLVLG